jgi:hypothetical protein
MPEVEYRRMRYSEAVILQKDINIDIKIILKWILTKLYGNIWVGVS